LLIFASKCGIGTSVGQNFRAALAQPVEHRIRNARVRCSSHLSGTIFLQSWQIKHPAVRFGVCGGAFFLLTPDITDAGEHYAMAAMSKPPSLPRNQSLGPEKHSLPETKRMIFTTK
jgi:hypothetical protein